MPNNIAKFPSDHSIKCTVIERCASSFQIRPTLKCHFPLSLTLPLILFGAMDMSCQCQRNNRQNLDRVRSVKLQKLNKFPYRWCTLLQCALSRIGML